MKRRVVIVLLFASLSSSWSSSSLPRRPDPVPVVRAFLALYAGGDVAAARALWAGGALDATLARRMEKRCLRLIDVIVEVGQDVAAAGDDVATLDTRETFAVDGLRLEQSHSRFVLRREENRWRIVSWESREQALVDRLAAAIPAERARIVAESSALQTETFVRLLGRRVVERVNANQLDDAEELLAIAVATAERLGDTAALAEVTSVHSVVARYRPVRDLDLAVDLTRASVSFAEASGDADALAVSLLRVARLDEEVHGRRDPAPLERAMALADRVEHAATLSHVATHLFRAYEGGRRAREAFRYAELASRYAEISGDTAARISASIVLSGAYLWFGDGRLAEPHIRRAAELSLAAGFENGAALSFGSMANSYATRGEFEEGRRVLDRALASITSRGGVSMLLRARAGMHINLGDLAAAERDLVRSAEVLPADGSTIGEFEVTLAVIRSKQGRYEEAFELARRRGDISLIAHILRCLGRSGEALELMQEMLAHSTDSLSLLEPNRMLFAQSSDGHELVVDMLVERGRIAEAYDWAEAMKAGTLRYTLANGLDELLLSSPTDRDRESELAERVSGLNRALLTEKEGAKLEVLRHSLAAARIELLDFRQRAYVAVPAGAETQRAAPRVLELPASLDDVTIVSYVPTGESTTIFVNGPKRDGKRTLKAYVTPLTATALSRKAIRYADAVEQRNLRIGELGAELYDLLLRPLETELRAARMVCIIPAGMLWRVPFHALGPNGGPLLADRLPLFYAPSAAVLAASESKRRPREPNHRPALLAFANPRMSDAATSLYRSFDRDVPLGNLAEAEREVREIARFYGREYSAVHIGDAASETTLKREAPRYDVLHIATHGLVHEQAPMFSSLVLSPSSDGRADDGVLEAREIAALDLDADLAVLSACETGKGGGSGVIGLAWALLAAGCPTTVVSQWKAHSDATADLMVEFHRHLTAGASKPEALRRAQLALRRHPRYKHPFYWAPFVVVGAP